MSIHIQTNVKQHEFNNTCNMCLQLQRIADYHIKGTRISCIYVRIYVRICVWCCFKIGWDWIIVLLPVNYCWSHPVWVSVATGSRGDPPAPDWAPGGCSVQPGRPVCGHTGMEQGHEWCPEGGGGERKDNMLQYSYSHIAHMYKTQRAGNYSSNIQLS